ncbi:hypothetical protein HZR84_04755 [Hyphobacterium sp. CCMP332]|nr:hypothetical protein HZR84_04755 [Hyphobacterium sp. CCMP332]
MRINRIKIVLGIVAFLLLIPLVAMQLSDEVNWSINDFIVMALLLSGFGILADLILRKVRKISLRIIAFIAIFAVFVLVWAELAVGIFGSPFAGN